MRKAFAVLGCLAIIAVPLSAGFSVHAQSTNTAPSQAGSGTGGGWNGECPERQDIREERERIRAEHEELDAEHDRLKAGCMDAKGQERSECTEKKQALHAQMDALHDRMKALHDRAEADPGCHHEHKESSSKEPWPSREQQTGGTATQPQSGTAR